MGELELEPEVQDWYLSLDDDAQGRVDFHIDRLAQEGPLLDEPHTKQLDGKLRELRFYLGSRPTRIRAAALVGVSSYNTFRDRSGAGRSQYDGLLLRLAFVMVDGEAAPRGSHESTEQAKRELADSRH